MYSNEIRDILLKQFHLITLDINIVKHPWFIPCYVREWGFCIAMVFIYNLTKLSEIVTSVLAKIESEITYRFPNFSGCTAYVWDWMSNSIPHFIMDVLGFS